MMKLKNLLDEDFINYKYPSMFLIFPYCSFKCENESKVHCCQNSELIYSPIIKINENKIVERYITNPISKAIVCGGLEPFDSFEDLFRLIYVFRDKTNDDIVIYTGYTEQECKDNGWINKLLPYKNIIIKFGRFIPDQEKHYDEVLGVYLSSDNQYAKRIC